MLPASPKISDSRRRRLYGGKKLLLAAAILAMAGGLVIADRIGALGDWLGASQTDFEKYNGKTFKVVKVVDGDTIDINIPDGGRSYTPIRLWGVDTPETVKPNTPPQRFGKEAGDFTKKMAKDQMVRLELHEGKKTRDKYGRLLAYIILPDGTMLNRRLVQDGYAYADPLYPHKYTREFAKLEADARKAKRGLWNDYSEADLPKYKRDEDEAKNKAAGRSTIRR